MGTGDQAGPGMEKEWAPAGWIPGNGEAKGDRGVEDTGGRAGAGTERDRESWAPEVAGPGGLTVSGPAASGRTSSCWWTGPMAPTASACTGTVCTT